jgi:hypothetical protein
MKSHPYYTYFHTRNDTGGVFYIGKGKAWRANMTNRNKMWKAIAEWHKKSSEAQVGRKFSEEHRAKISAAGIGRVSANKGKILSQEWREKMSVAAKGRPKSEEHKAKIKAAHVARVARFKAEKLQ